MERGWQQVGLQMELLWKSNCCQHLRGGLGGEDRKWGSAVCCREPGAAYQLFRQSFTAVVTGGPGRWVCYGLPAPKWRWFCIRGGSSGWSRGTPLSSHVSAYISLSWGGWKAGGGVRQLSIGLPGELGRAPAAYRATCSA